MLNFFKWFNSDKKVQEIEKEVNVLNSHIPYNKDYLFQANGTVFVGCRDYSPQGQTHIIIESGLLTVNQEVSIIREATKEESLCLLGTKSNVEQHYVVRYFQLQDIA